MKTISYKYMFLYFVLFISSIIICNISLCESLDQVINPKTAYNKWVSDMAGIIDDETESQLNAFIDGFEKKTTAEFAVVTIQNTDGSTPKEFATELFNRWGIGKKGKDNGVLVLLVMGERRIEVETGYGIEGVLSDGKVGEILRNSVVPYFKQGEFGKGILAGVQSMARVITNDQSEIAVSSDSQSSVAQDQSWGAGGWIFAGFILLIIASPWIIIYLLWRHFYVRHCPNCHKRMRKLSEDQDDVYLSIDQQFEEKLGSVNYKVWRCDDCQINKIERSNLGYGTYEDCPKCKHRTVYIKSARLKEPTTISKGLEEITKKCRYPKCGYHNVSTRSIPPIIITGSTRSSRSGSWSSSGGSSWSSSSSGSFGGGSSGGGGAGSSW